MLAGKTTKPRVSADVFSQVTFPSDAMRTVCGFTAW